MVAMTYFIREKKNNYINFKFYNFVIYIYINIYTIFDRIKII